MIVGVDASNVRTGGGITHLTNLLASAHPEDYGISSVIVWGNRNILDRLPEQRWLEKVHAPCLERALPQRLWWQRFRLPALARARCDVLFSPGGNAPPGFAPLVTMSRNMLPFEWRELRRYGLSWMSLRLLLLRFGQARTFERAQGVIFLNHYAQAAVRKVARIRGSVITVPHGVEERFRKAPRPQRPLLELSPERPLRLLYVSIIDFYKHQWVVADAVAALRGGGLPLVVDFVGAAYPAARRRFDAALARLDATGEFLRYRGFIPFEKLHALSDEADVFVFASSCENMPNILLEAMAAGFPIACARRGPMEEILGEAGVYFDPEDAASIEKALRALIEDAALRQRCAEAAYARARAYSWDRCARETFAFLQQVAQSSTRG